MPDPSQPTGDFDPMREGPAEEQALAHARRVFEAYREGILHLDDQQTDVRFVTDHDTGRIVASVPAATFFAGQHVLFVPEETDDALQLLCSAEEVPESAMTDRWIAFHVADEDHPEHTRWAAFWIDAAKHGPWVFDGEALMVPNPVAAQEPSICKRVNASPAELERVCAERTGAEETSGALCVGVDPGGLYVRLRHGVVRVPFPEPEVDHRIETLESLVDRLLASAA